MPTGIVKVFYRSKGYGFIRRDNDDKDIFVHRTALETAGLKDLRKGQRVSFDHADDQGRLFAKNLRIVDEEGAEQGSSIFVSPRTEGDTESMRDKSNPPDRKPITLATLERSLTDAVRKVAPECEAFVGVIVERVVPKTPDGVNWVVKGVRYGKANRNRCETALGLSLHEKQQEYSLVDDRVEPGKQS
jgi:cold shock protein